MPGVLDKRHSIQQLGETVVNQRGYIVFGDGDTVPTDTTAGYEVGCIWIDTNGADGSVIYVNEGTAASCDFNVLTGGTTAAEAAVLAGVTAGTGAASKAVVLDANGSVTYPAGTAGTTEVAFDGNNLAAPGVGISGGTGTVIKTSVFKIGGIITTRILIDLTGLNGGGTAGDIIGTDGAGAAYLCQITAAKNGTIIGGRMSCHETPAGSNVDVDLWSANEATGVEDTAISALTGEVQLINHGNWTAGDDAGLTDYPVADQYLYLTSGAATDATFTAGRFLIELFGYDA